MFKNLKLSEQDLENISKAIKNAESKTSGELVCQIVPSSSGYLWIHFLSCLLGITIATVVFWGKSQGMHWASSIEPLNGYELVVYQLYGLFTGFALSYLNVFKAILIPTKLGQTKVHQMAMSNFMSLGLTNTRDRTGVLIYISELERKVEILADKGIDSKTPPNYWDNQVNHLIAGIKKRTPAVSIIAVVDQIGERLAKNFPPRSDDRNELSDTVQIGHHNERNDSD